MTNPHSIEAERALIGAMLVDSEVISQIGLSADEFHVPSNSKIYKDSTGKKRNLVDPTWIYPEYEYCTLGII